MQSRFALASIALVSAVSIACSSSGGDTPPVTDTGITVDTGKSDTAPKDTGSETETAPIVCDQPLPGSFVCETPTKTAGATTCTEAMLQEFAAKCITADFVVPAGCAAWKTANTACASCVEAWSIDPKYIPGKVVPDPDKCMFSIFDAKCSKAVSCSWSCQDTVCADCSFDIGTGTTADSSEYDDCTSRAIAATPKGRCYDLAAKDADACFTTFETAIAPCSMDELYYPSGAGGDPDVTLLREESVVLLRGACRDNGDWKNSTSAGDAGTDSASGG